MWSLWTSSTVVWYYMKKRHTFLQCISTIASFYDIFFSISISNLYDTESYRNILISRLCFGPIGPGYYCIIWLSSFDDRHPTHFQITPRQLLLDLLSLETSGSQWNTGWNTELWDFSSITFENHPLADRSSSYLTFHQRLMSNLRLRLFPEKTVKKQ